MKQYPLFEISEEKETRQRKEWGTFKDSLRAPIHNWFTYPAGFSYKAVEASLAAHNITEGQVIYDPFMGSGTTNLAAKKLGISSYGVEAHPFVFRIARTKLNWELNQDAVLEALRKIENEVKKKKATQVLLSLEDEFPPLVLKCYANSTLRDLLFIRNAILEHEFPEDIADFFFVALTALLRQISTAATGWPYIAPKKQKTTSLHKNALHEFIGLVYKMLKDIRTMIREANPRYENAFHRIYNTDARNVQAYISDESVDHVFTSPPYLNNFDYADRTRLELYFWGEAKNWGEISRNIRTKLITSATTQISRSDPRYTLPQTLPDDVREFLQDAIRQLGKIRLTRGGKKSYDLLVAGYFKDMASVLEETYRVLKPHTSAVFVLGDSAPYGIHIPTDELIGKIGIGKGFASYDIEVLRKRGGKWKENPQRHNISLRESIVTLTKD